MSRNLLASLALQMGPDSPVAPKMNAKDRIRGEYLIVHFFPRPLPKSFVSIPLPGLGWYAYNINAKTDPRGMHV